MTGLPRAHGDQLGLDGGRHIRVRIVPAGDLGYRDLDDRARWAHPPAGSPGGRPAVAVVAGHNLLDGIRPEAFGPLAILWNFLHVPAFASFGGILYPILPWLGVMMLGYALGGVFELDSRLRRRALVVLGVGFLAAFTVIRLVNGYDDTQHWSEQRNALYTVFSFLNVSKYPPSLLYVLMTLGPALLMMALFERTRARMGAVLGTFGRVPLFVYVLHIYLIHLLAGLVALAAGHGTTVLTSFAFGFPPTWGYGLGIVYLVWVIVLVLLYPLAKWFAGVKQRRRDWWLSYL